MKKKKLVAPIVVAVLLVAYFLFFFAVVLWLSIPWWGKLLGGLIPLALAGAVIFVLVERIHEIRSGEEDDLSQY